MCFDFMSLSFFCCNVINVVEVINLCCSATMFNVRLNLCKRKMVFLVKYVSKVESLRIMGEVHEGIKGKLVDNDMDRISE